MQMLKHRDCQDASNRGSEKESPTFQKEGIDYILDNLVQKAKAYPFKTKFHSWNLEGRPLAFDL